MTPDGPKSRGGAPFRPANKRGVARLAAVQALYQLDIGDASTNDVIKEFELFRLRQDLDGEQLRDADLGWFRSVVEGVVRDQATVDGMIDEALRTDWPLTRIDLTLRAVLRAGTWELVGKPDVPAKVVIAEYLDVARAFFAEDEPKIVNGVLDRLAHRTRPDEFHEDRAPGR